MLCEVEDVFEFFTGRPFARGVHARIERVAEVKPAAYKIRSATFVPGSIRPDSEARSVACDVPARRASSLALNPARTRASRSAVLISMAKWCQKRDQLDRRTVNEDRERIRHSACSFGTRRTSLIPQPSVSSSSRQSGLVVIGRLVATVTHVDEIAG